VPVDPVSSGEEQLLVAQISKVRLPVPAPESL
jgi:hypothetical protein